MIDFYSQGIKFITINIWFKPWIPVTNPQLPSSRYTIVGDISDYHFTLCGEIRLKVFITILCGYDKLMVNIKCWFILQNANNQ